MPKEKFLTLIREYCLNRFLLLLGSLLLIFVFLPCLEIESHEPRILLLNTLFIVVLVCTLRAASCVCKGWRWMTGLILLGAFAIVFRWYGFLSGTREAYLIATILDLILFAICSISILVLVLRTERVTTDKVLAAICVYFLIGLVWAFKFSILDFLRPNAFHLSESILLASGTTVAEQFSMVKAIYFSFTTLTTLGYGDISPAISSAQALSSLEAATGQLYIAVLVARLVSLNVAYSLKTNHVIENVKE